MDYTQIYADLKTLMAGVADKIGQGASYGWQVAVKQQYVVGISDFIIAAALAIAIIALIVIALKIYKAMNKSNADVKSEYVFGIGILVSTILIFGAISVSELIDGVQHVINPDYYAIQFFVGLVHGNTTDNSK